MTDYATARMLLDRLVAFPTVSRGGNRDLIDWVAGWLSGQGIEAVVVPDPSDPRKASLFAQVGPAVPGGVVLSGHSDVVPVEGQDWSSDPWTVTERDGRLYGRGTCDMKGFDALALAALAAAARRPLKRPLQLALSHDEELGCIGCIPMIEAMADLPRASAVVVGEPTMMKAVTGHKGGVAFWVRMRGHEVHSSLMHTGVSAILEGAKLLMWVNEMNAAGQAAAKESPFVPPWTTVHTGEIHGGTAHNITAGNCEFGVDFRVLPGEDPQEWRRKFLAKVAEVEAGMKAIHPDAGIEVTEKFALPGLAPETDGAAEALVRAITGDNGSQVVSYGTEAGQFQVRGWSAVVCGPGDIEQAHKPDEYLEVAQFRAGWAFMENLLERLEA
ncbi:acetylornithine deacetylase [Paenirhodobacter sp. CAU 1674]|uniref:acetylornithine deacetylase n=1 Tax=Paenirhodobacter sp. CAU 1674 TaxID=3032596 RepID=UPI0023DB0E3C|nr:acetylornithine deacetylase [Paenirhodobacter sp. CAU 1674]MDF2140074.1 acetylornithine deacetylase [Paenirhodobacter sp. CAU 1674]